MLKTVTQRRIGRALAWSCLAAGIVAAAAAGAQERKAYKYVDEKGNVVYSQTPPNKDAKQINIAPAHRGAGGSTVRGPYDDPNRYSSDRQDPYQAQLRERQQAMEEAQKRRQAELEAECNRNRGADCKNPDTLRLIESNQLPGGRRYPLPAR